MEHLIKAKELVRIFKGEKYKNSGFQKSEEL